MAKRKKTRKRNNGFSKNKKVVLTVFILLAVIVGTSAVMRYVMPTESSHYIVPSESSAGKLYLTAHRGLSAVAPENTLPAFEAAGQAGYFACEFDIHETKDGKWAVMHNEDISDMTDSTGNISLYTYDELLNFNIDAGSNINNFSSLKIPELSEALDICKKYSMRACIEIKSGREESLDGVLKMIKDSGVDAEIISFNFDYLTYIRRNDPDIRLMYLVSGMDKDTIAKCRDAGNIGVAFRFNAFGDLFKVKKIKEAGLECSVWTVDSVFEADICRLFKIDRITTNRILP